MSHEKTAIETGIAHASFTLEREFAAPVEHVFAAFSNPVRKRRWFITDLRSGMEVLDYRLEFVVGGRESTRFRTAVDSPLRGAELTNETVYMDIVENERIVIAYTMAADSYRFSASMASFVLQKTAQGGTRLIFHEQGAFFANSDGVEHRRAGWTRILDALTNEVNRTASHG